MVLCEAMLFQSGSSPGIGYVSYLMALTVDGKDLAAD